MQITTSDPLKCPPPLLENKKRCNMSFPAILVKLLVLVGFQPSSDSLKSFNVVTISIWTLIGLGISTVYVYTIKSLFGIPLATTTQMFQQLSLVAVPCINLAMTVPAIAYLSLSYPGLVTEKNLPPPKHLKMFLLNRCLQVLNLVAVIWYLVPVVPTKGLVVIPMVLIASDVYHQIIVFQISVVLNHTCMSITQSNIWLFTKNPSTISTALHMIKNVKSGIAPCLILIFSLKCITIINDLLYLATCLDSLGLLAISQIVLVGISISMEFLYITLIVEHTLSILKGIAIKVRYIYKDFD